MMETLHIIKIGGNVVNNEERLNGFLDRFNTLSYPKILVHGGGNSASELCKKLNIPIQIKDGRRITDEPTLDVAVMVYAGLINKTIVAKLQGKSLNALGLSGADLNIIPAKKRSDKSIDYGFVGDIDSERINTYFLGRLLDEQIIPVIPAITHDNNGQLLNTNADTIASTLAIALSSQYQVTLTFCFDKPGVLNDAENDKTLISNMTQQQFIELKDGGIIYDGMIPKLDTAFDALSNEVHQVQIKHAQNITTQIGTTLAL